MAQPIDTLNKAAQRGMLVKSECACGNVRYYRAMDLLMVYGGGRDPLTLKFECTRCRPDINVVLINVDLDRLPKTLLVHKPMRAEREGKVLWVMEKFRG